MSYFRYNTKLKCNFVQAQSFLTEILLKALLNIFKTFDRFFYIYKKNTIQINF